MFENVLKNFEILFLYVLINLNSLGINPYDIPDNKVIKIIDGDTVEIYHGKKIEKVRLIGVNTPETVDPRKHLECFGLESSSNLKKLLDGKVVKLDKDESQDNKDRYGRLLRYVILEEVNINKKIIEEGFGFEYTYKKPYKFKKEFKSAELSAKEKGLGLWSKESCNY
jgi:micrococcal nuclease